MNDNDKNNLNFLLTSSQQSIKTWYYTVNKDDHRYALELLAEHSRELARMDAELDETTTEFMVDSFQGEYPEASMVIDRIMKMGV